MCEKISQCVIKFSKIFDYIKNTLGAVFFSGAVFFLNINGENEEICTRILKVQITTMGFEVNRKKHFLTWSCPVDADEHPIPSKELLLTFLKTKGDLEKFVIACELHESGKKHYHAYIEMNIHTRDVRFFDYGVHPNWQKGIFERHVKYCKKHGDFITEGCEGKVNHFKEASLKRSAEDAIEYLWENEPKSMLLHGHNIERNVRRKLDINKLSPRLYYGPYRFKAPADWDRDKQTLLVTGPVGTGKTQWARYFCDHQGGYFYCKSSLECLKHYKGQPWIIFDDINVTKYNFDCWADVFDVNDGGAIPARYGDIIIPPGVKKIWLQNPSVQIKDAHNRVLHNRRSYEIDYFY